MAHEGCHHVWVFQAGVSWWTSSAWVSISIHLCLIYLCLFYNHIDWEFWIIMTKLWQRFINSNDRIDSLEKFHERIPFLRSELKDERMINGSWCLLFTWIFNLISYLMRLFWESFFEIDILKGDVKNIFAIIIFWLIGKQLCICCGNDLCFLLLSRKVLWDL